MTVFNAQPTASPESINPSSLLMRGINSSDVPGKTDNIMLRDNLLREAHSLRAKQQPEWDKSHNLYNGNHWDHEPPRGLKQFTINRIYQSIIAKAAIQCEERPSIELRPVENNEPPLTFLSKDGALKVRMVGMPLTSNQFAGLEPISEEMVGQLMSITPPPEPAPEPPPTPDAPPPIQPDPAMSHEVKTDAKGGTSTKTSVMPGEPVQTAPTPMAPLPPPPSTKPIFNEKDFIILDDQAVVDALEGVIDVQLERAGFDRVFHENVVDKLIYGHQATRVEWQTRLQKMVLTNIHPKNLWIDPTSSGVEDAAYVMLAEPMSTDRALTLFPDQAAAIKAEMKEGNITQTQAQIFGTTLGQPWSGTDFRRSMSVVWTIWMRDQEFENDPNAILETGEEYHVGIRELKMVGNATIYDQECADADIPIAWNINTRKNFTPYGIGDPAVLKDPNELLDRLWSIATNHYRYFQSPQTYMLQSTFNSLGADKVKDLHSHPGKTILVDDDVFAATGGRMKMVEEPPAFPAAIPAMIQLATNEFKEISGYTDVLTGTPHSGAESGIAIQSLQNAAKGSIGFSSLFSEDWIKYIVKLLIRMILKDMSDKQLERCYGKVPGLWPVLRTRAEGIEMDVTCNIVSGRGRRKQDKEMQAKELFQLGLADVRDTLEALGVPDAAGRADRLSARQAAAAKPSVPAKSPAESINYKDCPPDIQRQLEAQAGLQPSKLPPPQPAPATKSSGGSLQSPNQ